MNGSRLLRSLVNVLVLTAALAILHTVLVWVPERLASADPPSSSVLRFTAPDCVASMEGTRELGQGGARASGVNTALPAAPAE